QHPQDPRTMAVSVEELWQERVNPPNWERISNYIAIVTACLLFTFIEILNFRTYGTSMRIFSGLCIAFVLYWLWTAWGMNRRYQKERRSQKQQIREGWSDLT